MWNVPGVASFRLGEPGAGRVLVAVFAHPDDESFGPGGTLARYAAQGVDVHYVCATRGEVGMVDPALMAGFADVGDLRWAELECAARILGLVGLHWLGYRDSGMPGAEENRHPSALVQAPRPVVVGRIVALIRALQPDVVITFDPHGGYGHPDHIAIHHATREAFAAAGGPEAYPEQAAAGRPPFVPRKLYYTAFPRGLLKLTVFLMRLARQDPTRFGRNRDINLAEIASWETPVTTRIDVSRFLDAKQKASACHRSQSGPGGLLAWIPGVIRRRLADREPYTRACPPWTPGEATEDDLFAGL